VVGGRSDRSLYSEAQVNAIRLRLPGQRDRKG